MPNAPLIPRRPLSVTLLAVIGIILGIGTFCLTALSLFTFSRISLTGSPIPAALRQDPVYLLALAIELVIALPLELFKIAACESCLALRPWARRGLIVYALVSIAQGVLGILFAFIYTLPRLAADATPAALALRHQLTLQTVERVVFTPVAAIYPACVLYFFTQPPVIDAFRPNHGASVTNPAQSPQAILPAANSAEETLPVE